MERINFFNTQHSDIGLLGIGEASLTRFTMVNDLFGPDVGDIFLEETYLYLKTCLPLGGKVQRDFADRWSLYWPNPFKSGTLIQFAKQLDQGMKEVVARTLNGRNWPFKDKPVTLAIGMLIVKPNDSQLSAWLNKANKLAYKAKVASWNSTHCHLIVERDLGTNLSDKCSKSRDFNYNGCFDSVPLFGPLS